MYIRLCVCMCVYIFFFFYFRFFLLVLLHRWYLTFFGINNYLSETPIFSKNSFTVCLRPKCTWAMIGHAPSVLWKRWIILPSQQEETHMGLCDWLKAEMYTKSSPCALSPPNLAPTMQWILSSLQWVPLLQCASFLICKMGGSHFFSKGLTGQLLWAT